MIRNFLSALLATAAAFLCVNCSGSTGVATPQRTAPPDPQWVTSISQHSNGAISRHSPVRVLFTNDVVSQERVGSDATANISISPAVKMRATFASRREIVLRAEPEFRARNRIPRQRACEGIDRRARGHEALRIPGQDPGRELRRPHLRTRSHA